MRTLVPTLLCLALVACAGVPPEPDYSDRASWAARPDTVDAADVNPVGVTGVDPARAKVDVFFVHPTSYAGAALNAPIDDAALNAKTDSGTLANQASVFNGCCRVFAPRYRQAALSTYVWRSDSVAEQAWLLAYGDVKRAFEHYLAHDNGGRPFIIASHSQGSRYALWLLQDEIEGTPLQRQLIAAYVMGYGIPADVFTRNLKSIGVCQGATDTGCVLNWNTFEAGGDPSSIRDRDLGRYGDHFERNAGKPLVCTNPLSWRDDGAHADARLNLGAWAILDGKNRAPESGFTGARCDDGALFTDPLDLSTLRIPELPGKNLHMGDYQLFYMNVRQNVAARAEAFLSAHPTSN